MNDLALNWYKNLVNDLLKLEFSGIVITKWHQGKRIDNDIEKFGKPEYGKKRIVNLAKDLKTSGSNLWACHRFYKKYPTKEKLDAVQQFSWKYIWHKLLPAPKADKIPIELPYGKYNIIYADPPWKYWAGGWKNAQQHYDTMTIQDIKDMPVPNLTADDCILFLWATFPCLPDAFEVIKAWGFNYSTVGFVWVKSLKDKTGFAFGTGNWTRANAELCLIATKGSIERKDASVSQIIYEPLQEHSRKPAIVREKIVQLVGDLPKTELFARQKTKGWKSWGNELQQ